MKLRATMAPLIGAVRRLIGDRDALQTWLDLDLQEALDRHRDDVRYLELTPGDTIQPGGAVVYLDYYASRGDWETDAALYDAQGNALTPSEADTLTGHWTFGADRRPPVFLVGKTYDRYAAAADVLEEWAARLKLEFDFSSNDQRFARSQQPKALLDLAATYRAKQRPAVAALVRGDTC